ncbi:hypothetical protein [Palleronia abyssalis]|uniref:Uncharacterized protein n=1 Tax=Palleronia abyssalis TaxID=1501240 RepID=A0A2R8BYY6_9RHOB|nr:hypothetical protein [Palleronia abyssalis]SPJ25381.1 hypothetical protein PAA8504_03232 [Palleronia abyssalis]
MEFLYVYSGMVAVAAIIMTVIGRRSFHRTEAEAARNGFAGFGETIRAMRLEQERQSSSCRGSSKSRISDVPSQAYITRPRPGMPKAVWPWPAP